MFLDIIAKEINNDWRALSCELGVNKSPEECLHQSYKELEHKIIWKNLKEKLIKINRQDIVALVEKEDLITVGKKKDYFTSTSFKITTNL